MGQQCPTYEYVRRDGEMLVRLRNIVRKNKLFVRMGKSENARILAILLTQYGLSYRKVAEIISDEERVSYEAVRLWYHRAKKLFSVERKKRDEIAIDETKIKLNGKWYYLWAAIDVHTREILAVHLTSSRSSLDALIFLQKVLKSCKNKPKVYVDGGPWYPWALQRLGVPWEHMTFGKRNAIEQWFGIFKHRIKRFYAGGLQIPQLILSSPMSPLSLLFTIFY